MKNNNERIAIYWSIEDIQGQAKNAGIDLTDEQAYEILQALPHIHDATVGINWDVIDTLIQEYI